jgi:hypothetical protein
VTLVPIATVEREGGVLVHEPLPETLGLERVNEWIGGCGVPRRYREATWEGVTPELREDVQTYCREIAKNLRDGHGITLVGGVGVGKTHALVLIVDAALSVKWRTDVCLEDWQNLDDDGKPNVIWQVRDATVEWALGPKLYSVLHRPDAPGHREKIAKCETCDLLVIDDFDRLYATDWNIMQLEALMEVRHSERRATALSLNSTQVLQSEKFARTLDRLMENSTVVRLGKNLKSRRGAE